MKKIAPGARVQNVLCRSAIDSSFKSTDVCGEPCDSKLAYILILWEMVKLLLRR